MNEFIEGMSTLFFDSIDKLEKFIFQLYDFDKDGLISKEDVRVVLSYIPLNVRSKVNSELRLKYEQLSLGLILGRIIRIESNRRMNCTDCWRSALKVLSR